MDILTNKTYPKFNYTCRYTGIPYYYNTEDKKYIFGTSYNILRNISYTLHDVKETDTWDSLSLKYYNNPTYYWVLAGFNECLDCLQPLYGNYTTIKVPNIANIKFGDDR